MTYFDHTFGGKHVRSVIIDGAPWFVAIDVCKCLGIANSRDALSEFPSDECMMVNLNTVGSTDGIPDVATLNAYNSTHNKGGIPNVASLKKDNTIDSNYSIMNTASLNSDRMVMMDKEHHRIATLSEKVRGNPNVNCVNEPGLYRLIFQSRKKKAEEFKRWVLHEVLPALRRYGAYEIPIKGEQPADVPVYNPFQERGADAVNNDLNYFREVRIIHGKQQAAAHWIKMGYPIFATEDAPFYEGDESPFRAFVIDTCYVTGSSEHELSPSDLYLAYLKWCKEKLNPPVSKAGFYRNFSSQAGKVFHNPDGFICTFRRHKRGSTIYIGITLKTEYITEMMTIMD